MVSKPELPDLARDMEIKHALRRMSPRKSGKVDETTEELKTHPIHER